MIEKRNIWIIWAWAWWIALAYVLDKNWHNVTLWEFDKKTYENILNNRQIPNRLPWFYIPKSLNFTNNIEEVLENNIILNVIPAQTIRSTLKNIEKNIGTDIWKEKIVINASKWIEMKTWKNVIKIYSEETNLDMNNYMSLSWPSFAYEVCSNPTLTKVSLGWQNQDRLEYIAKLFNNDLFSVCINYDPLWTELCWSLKNIYAVWSWIISWLGWWINTKSIIITKWLKEISEFIDFVWWEKETIYKLCWIWDLILTCSSKLSRNYKVWKRIWSWEKMEDIVWSSTMEWVFTSKIVYEISEKHNLKMPIVKCIYEILYENHNPKNILKAISQD